VTTPELEEFAKILVQRVRDAAIQSNDSCLRPDATHIVAKRWKEAGRNGTLQSIANVLIPDVVDDTVFHLLRAIDQGVLKISFTAPNGKTIDLSKEGLGELGGWYSGGKDSWRAAYSHERFIDDFSDF
jgi:hypothetical protein